MTTNYVLPLKAPAPLPADGVDIVKFKVWKNTLVAHIQQDANHHQFMPGGIYQTWIAAWSHDTLQRNTCDDENGAGSVRIRCRP